jgi:hypothetical protein
MVATALLAAFPFLPFALPKRVQSIAGIWVMAACSLIGLAFGFWPQSALSIIWPELR